jgi:hypothetical protein
MDNDRSNLSRAQRLIGAARQTAERRTKAKAPAKADSVSKLADAWGAKKARKAK